MTDKSKSILEKITYIDNLLGKLENKDIVTINSILQEEIDRLRTQIAEYKLSIENKEVIEKEECPSKIRYYLKDGSVYVVKNKEYKYLYDAATKVVTYEFENGQIERTFESGLKEIRRSDGSIIIKSSPKEFDYVTRLKSIH